MPKQRKLKGEQETPVDYAERVLPLFEKEFPDDKRPRKGVDAVREFIDGKITKKELRAVFEGVLSAKIEAMTIVWYCRNTDSKSLVNAEDAFSAARTVWEITHRGCYCACYCKCCR